MMMMMNISKEFYADDFSLGYLASILSLHYLVKCRSRSLAIYNNEFILDSARVCSEMINWKASNTIGNYCIPKSHTCYITVFLLQNVFKMSSSSANASNKRWHYSQTAGWTTCISQGSVVTVLKWGGQQYSLLHAKDYSNRLMLHAANQKIKVSQQKRTFTKMFVLLHVKIFG